MQDGDNKLYKVWGKFHGYPQCCVDWFVKVPHYDRPKDYCSGAADGSGFLPCPECSSKCETLEGLIKLLGRNPHTGASYLETWREALKDVKTSKFDTIANEFEFNYTHYLEWLEDGYEKVLSGE